MPDNFTEQPDVLAALRSATAERHDELDANTPLAAPEVDLHAYGDHLRLLEQWLAPISAWLAGFDDGPRLPDYLGAIRADLAHPALNAAPPMPMTAQRAPWPARASAAYRWGVCYVVEGSQLGGAVLYKRLAATLAPHPLAYLRGAGSPGPRWQQFLGALRAQVSQPQQVADACQGAIDAFDSLIALNRARAALA
ncbi:MAG: biliverdin-producing heme oxygenase [Duganella sp.]